MRKTKNKNLKKQILTLTLAFVLVFTGMGIGSWGVDEAWADTTDITFTKSEISAGCYDKAINCTGISIGSTEIEKLYIKSVYVGDEFRIGNLTGGNTALGAVVALDGSYVDGSAGRFKIASKQYYTKNDTQLQKAPINEKALKDTLGEDFFNNNCGAGLSAYYFLGFTGSNFDTKFGLLIQITEKKDTIGKKELDELITTVTGENEKNWYRENDRYNGKKSSEKGFWIEMQEALEEAKSLYINNEFGNELKDVTDTQIVTSYRKLEVRVSDLIPATEANTTALYEALQDCPATDGSFSYDEANFATFTEKKNTAETLFSSLFLDNKATAMNTPEKQDEINRVVAELRDSYSDGKMAAKISTQEALENFLAKASNDMQGRVLKNLTLTEYERSTSFNGELDGNGHVITVDSAYHGLVEINHGVIQNLTVRGADLEFGYAICSTNNGLIENCHNSVNFIGKEKRSYGICTSNEKSGIIRNCYNTGKLTGIYVGGICGTNLGLVENCFNTGLIDAESNAGGIVRINHSDASGVNAKSGVIRNCYNFNVMHHTAGWDSFYGSYICKNLGPICGNNEKASVSISATSSKIIDVEGTVENGLYLDTVISNKPNGRSLSIALSDIYLAQKKAYDDLGAGTSAGTAIAGWTEKDSANSIFAYDTDYYVFYDNTNGHFIAVTFDDAATSAVIDAAKPSAQSELCKSAAGAEKEFYLVKVPTGTKAVTFKNTEMIIDYANGYTNRYVKAYQQLDNFGVNFGPELSRKFVGTAIGSSDVSTILSKVSAICGSDTATVAFVKEMLSGIEAQGSTVTPTEKDIKVKFRFVGATKSPSGNYDAKTNKDSQYVTWIATRTYSLKDGSSVGDLLKLAIKESGIKTVGEENNYVSGVYAPNVLGNYYLAEFTNGTRSGWMYTVNGKHPSVGLNGYYLKDGDSVIWHYINDYSYEVSDWFDDPLYPNLGNASTWDPWLKVPDVDPTKDTPTLGGAQTEEVKDVTTDTKTGTTTAPTDVKVSEKTNADGTKTKVADVKVSADNQKEILKQAAEKKSAEIILEVSKADSKGADSVQLSLDVTFVKNVADKTNADLTVNTENGKVTLDQETIKTILAEAKGATITLEVTKVSKPTEVQKKAAGANGHLLKLTIKSGDKVISDFNKGKVKVVAEIVSKLLDKKVAAIHIAEDGKIEQLEGKTVKIDGKDYYIFETPHFSTFALVDAEELGLEVNDEEANIVKIKELVSDMSLKARSSKTSKKNIKVTLTVDKSTAAAIKEIKDMGYTVKYKYYRSTKKASKYQAKITKTTKSFTNTAGKKGTRYYYKARIQVYDKDGKLVAQTALKQCKYAARTWTK